MNDAEHDAGPKWDLQGSSPATMSSGGRAIFIPYNQQRDGCLQTTS